VTYTFRCQQLEGDPTALAEEQAQRADVFLTAVASQSSVLRITL
jgi:hypothetical protein